MCLLCGVSCLLPVLSAGSWERKAVEYYPFTAEYRFLLCLRHSGAVGASPLKLACHTATSRSLLFRTDYEYTVSK